VEEPETGQGQLIEGYLKKLKEVKKQEQEAACKNEETCICERTTVTSFELRVVRLIIATIFA
jgi:hypothetical protein